MGATDRQTVSIVGAGVAGLAIAVELARRGHPVRVLDRTGPPGPHGCSWWAGGMLAPHCERESADVAVVRLGMAAADWWAGVGAEVTRRGSLVIAPNRDRRELERFARRTAGFEVLDADALAGLEPDLVDRFTRALYFPTEAHVAPRQALAALVDRLAEHGVAVEQAEPALNGLAAEGPVIDARGLAARDALADLRGVKGEMLVLSCPDVSLTRPVRLIHPRAPLYIVPRGDGVFMLGATQIEAAERSRVTARSLLELLSVAYALHPAFGEAEVLEIGVDARPAFPDNLPRLVRQGGVIHANGLFRHGFLLAPALAQQAAALVAGQTPELLYDDHRERDADGRAGDGHCRAAV
ncbi:MAG: glycine oxidase ThiO [Pseudomonadota bacterium]